MLIKILGYKYSGRDNDLVVFYRKPNGQKVRAETTAYNAYGIGELLAGLCWPLMKEEEFDKLPVFEEWDHGNRITSWQDEIQGVIVVRYLDKDGNMKMFRTRQPSSIMKLLGVPHKVDREIAEENVQHYQRIDPSYAPRNRDTPEGTFVQGPAPESKPTPVQDKIPVMITGTGNREAVNRLVSYIRENNLNIIIAEIIPASNFRILTGK